MYRVYAYACAYAYACVSCVASVRARARCGRDAVRFTGQKCTMRTKCACTGIMHALHGLQRVSHVLMHGWVHVHAHEHVQAHARGSCAPSFLNPPVLTDQGMFGAHKPRTLRANLGSRIGNARRQRPCSGPVRARATADGGTPPACACLSAAENGQRYARCSRPLPSASPSSTSSAPATTTT